jgi:hypothetical protein
MYSTENPKQDRPYRKPIAPPTRKDVFHTAAYIATASHRPRSVTKHRPPIFLIPLKKSLYIIQGNTFHFLIIKPTRRTNFSNLFWNEILHVSDSSSVHHQEFFTVQTATVYVIQVCRQLSSRIRIELQLHPDPAAARKLSVWHIPLLSLQWITPDDGQRNCPKHVEFHFKINLRNQCV